jgi:hypothetical protein
MTPPRVVCSRHDTTAGCEHDKRRPHELETLQELIEKEIKLTAWGRSVKRQNGLGKKNRGPTPSDAASPSAAVDKKGSEEDEDDGDTRQGRGKKGRKANKGKNKARRDAY